MMIFLFFNFGRASLDTGRPLGLKTFFTTLSYRVKIGPAMRLVIKLVQGEGRTQMPGKNDQRPIKVSDLFRQTR